MGSVTGMIVMYGAYFFAVWAGYQIGVQHGIDKCRTKRGVRRDV